MTAGVALTIFVPDMKERKKERKEGDRVRQET
jgi:hypothetical protein